MKERERERRRVRAINSGLDSRRGGGGSYGIPLVIEFGVFAASFLCGI